MIERGRGGAGGVKRTLRFFAESDCTSSVLYSFSRENKIFVKA